MFTLDFHRLTSMRPDLTIDAIHYPPLDDLYALLLTSAYQLISNKEWPGEPPVDWQPTPPPSSIFPFLPWKDRRMGTRNMPS
jgi:hypothetical protein